MVDLDNTADLIAQRLPKLIANWGVAPKIGTRCYPQFLLVCGEDYSDALLDVKFELDDQLEHKASDTQPPPRKNSEDHWIFKFPFKLSTNGSDCAPGIYNMKLELKFADLSDPLLPSHLFCDIRLTIPDADAAERVLEIDSDDKSIVNLQGLNFSQFSSVKLKGSGSGLINLLQGQSDDAEDEADDAADDDITQAYTLQVASKSEVNRLWQSTEITKRVCSKAASLRFSDGRNIVLWPQHRFEFGRSRESDIIVRFCPRSKDNDLKSSKLSRQHCIVKISEEGIEFQDKDSSGIELNWEPVKESVTLEPGEFKSGIPFVLGDMFYGNQLEMRLVPLVSEDHSARRQKDRRRLEDFAKETHLSLIWERLWKASNHLKLDAIRIERENNLSEEQYVVIIQQATIGSSDIDCAIVVQGLPYIAARLLYIGRIFWLNKAKGDWDVSVDGHSLASNEMVPLSPEHEIEIDGIKMTFGAKAQLYL